MPKKAERDSGPGRVASLLKRIFGTHRKEALWVILVLISLNLFAAGIQRLWDDPSAPLWRLVLIETLPCAILIGGLLLYARRAPHSPRPRRIRSYEHPAPVKVLILFLSPRPRVPEGQPDPLKQEGKLLDTQFLNSLGPIPWRMPLTAIAYHANLKRGSGSTHLELVVVIPSRDRFTDKGKLGGGTHRDFEAFRDFVMRTVVGEQELSKFEILSLHILLATRAKNCRVRQDYSHGVDFESPEELEEAVVDAYDALRSISFDDADVLVDVTGGQKPASIAGAVVALGKDRRIQYVSTHDYRVRAYDVTFDD